VTGTSAAGIIVIMAVVLVGALAMILWIFVVGRGSFRHRRIDHRSGDVRGGIHVGDPGSVMPRRDAPANPADPQGTGQDRPLRVAVGAVLVPHASHPPRRTCRPASRG
jgi:hypothetical protein